MTHRLKGTGGPLALVLVAFVVYLAVPGIPDSPFSGAPLPLASVWLLTGCLVGLAFIALVPPPGRLSVAWAIGVVALGAVKVTAGHGVTPEGWRGVYEMTDDPRVSPVSFIDGFSRATARVDRRLDFDADQFDLPFYNDLVRYGKAWGGTRRDFADPFEVQWSGYLKLDTAGPLSLTLRCRGFLTVAVDGSPIAMDVCPNGTSQTRPLAIGEHEISVHYIKPRNTIPLATVIPLTSAAVTPWVLWSKAARRQAVQIDLGAFVSLVTCLLVCMAVWKAYAPLAHAPGAVIRRHYGTLVALAVFAALLVAAVYTALPFRGVTTFLWAGDDALAYESSGRDIALNGLLNPNGAALGHGTPFYFYPLYPYALAMAHRMLGDDMGATVLFNGVCIASMVLLGWILVLRKLPQWAGAISTGVVGCFCLRYYHTYTMSAFTDNLFLPLVFLTLWATVAAVRRWTWSLWLGCGVLAALAAATRPSFMTYPGILAAFVVLGWQGRSLMARVRATGWLATGFFVGMSPFTIRNWLVSHKFVLLVNSWIQIPFFLEPPDEAHHAHAVAGLIDALQQAGQIFAANPGGVILVELRKLGFTLGWLTLGPAGQPPHPEFAVVTVLFVMAIVLRRVPGILAFVLCAFVVSHITAMILAAPWTYGFKTILPLQVAFLLGAILLLARPKDEPSEAPPSASPVTV